MKLRMIGYWGGKQWPEGPDPRELVDPDWDVDERDFVVGYLCQGYLLGEFMGTSPCRICGRPNGSAEFTDGEFLWPEGLAHYLAEHGVRLPAAFVDHATRRFDGLEGADRGDSWWLENWNRTAS
ncbi:hypothetical protein ACIQF6_03920 [Kitasatospora sp. NPDC092948]|uniref:hypothetical protein n=1 Tax=Kitasatospora sp. NPDC092948 TaxID=3364088 RepID=UPI003810F92D